VPNEQLEHRVEVCPVLVYGQTRRRLPGIDPAIIQPKHEDDDPRLVVEHIGLESPQTILGGIPANASIEHLDGTLGLSKLLLEERAE